MIIFKNMQKKVFMGKQLHMSSLPIFIIKTKLL